jgi:hypothetical protein
MPTALPARSAPRRPPSFLTSLAPILAALSYLLLLSWNTSTLAADLAAACATEHQGNYNPMEPAR